MTRRSALREAVAERLREIRGTESRTSLRGASDASSDASRLYPRVAWANLFARVHPIAATGKLSLAHATHPYRRHLACIEVAARAGWKPALRVSLRCIMLSYTLRRARHVERLIDLPERLIAAGIWETD